MWLILSVDIMMLVVTIEARVLLRIIASIMILTVVLILMIIIALIIGKTPIYNGDNSNYGNVLKVKHPQKACLKQNNKSWVSFVHGIITGMKSSP